MAKVRVENGWLDVQVSWLERLLLAEKPRRVPLSEIQAVNASPELLDMLLYWTSQRGVWLAGATTYEGYLVPSTRNPSSTLAIQVEGERPWYIELDEGQEPTAVADEIERAIYPRKVQSTLAVFSTSTVFASPRVPAAHILDEHILDEDDWDEEDDVRLRDPLMQGSLAPPPKAGLDELERPPRRQLRLSEDRDLSRLGGWLVAAGALGVLAGTTIVAAGLLPGLIAVGAGLACAVIGGLALALVAHHQG